MKLKVLLFAVLCSMQHSLKINVGLCVQEKWKIFGEFEFMIWKVGVTTSVTVNIQSCFDINYAHHLLPQRESGWTCQLSTPSAIAQSFDVPTHQNKITENKIQANSCWYSFWSIIDLHNKDEMWNLFTLQFLENVFINFKFPLRTRWIRWSIMVRVYAYLSNNSWCRQQLHASDTRASFNNSESRLGTDKFHGIEHESEAQGEMFVEATIFVSCKSNFRHLFCW